MFAMLAIREGTSKRPCIGTRRNISGYVSIRLTTLPNSWANTVCLIPLPTKVYMPQSKSTLPNVESVAGPPAHSLAVETKFSWRTRTRDHYKGGMFQPREGSGNSASVLILRSCFGQRVKRQRCSSSGVSMKKGFLSGLQALLKRSPGSKRPQRTKRFEGPVQHQ